MYRKLIAVAGLLILLIAGGCSSDEQENKQSKIDQATEQTARAIVEKIEQPIDKARQVQKAEDEHAAQLEKAAQ